MALDFADAQALHAQVYDGVNGKEVSYLERERHGVVDDKTLNYGELPFASQRALFEKASLGPADRFYDLGSGIGQVAVAVRLLFDVASVTGIEYLQDLHETATERLEFARSRVVNTEYESLLKHVEFRQGDFLEQDWSDATVVYAAATCFSEELFGAIVTRAAQLASGTRLILISKEVNHPDFSVVDEWFYTTSWGMSAGRVYVRR